MLLLSRAEVEELLDLDELTDALAGAMVDLRVRRASVPDRVAARRARIIGAAPAIRLRWGRTEESPRMASTSIGSTANG